MMKDHVSGSPDSSWAPPAEKKKERQKEITKEYPEGAEEHCLAKNQHKILKSGQKRVFALWNEGRKGKKVSKGSDGFQKGCFAFTGQMKAQLRIIPRTKAR